MCLTQLVGSFLFLGSWKLNLPFLYTSYFSLQLMMLKENLISSLGPPTQQQNIYVTFSQSGLRSKAVIVVCVPLISCDMRKSRLVFSRRMKLVNVCTVQMLVKVKVNSPITGLDRPRGFLGS